ncbi:Demethylmenaquinone methyltransferase [Cytospora mali]|uniref:Demethylmenaquinone methyltransferase n=1 Tax=Cytospora mali TaxID=578113 RepID=A0A194VLI7_CYTMA|nr:Demethylmenaquinone methyltransferase [Valsa mali]
METGKKPAARAGAPAAPPTPAAGGPRPVDLPPASVQGPSVQGQHAAVTHGEEARPLPVSTRYSDERSLGPQSHISDQTTERPRKKRARTDKGVDDSDEERQEAMDMVDRANAGQPVLSGPAALGLEQGSRKEQKGPTTSKSAHNGANQPQKSGQVQKSSPVSEGANLWGTSTWDPEDETNMYWEHGRRYARDYFMPNDEDEQDRLRILHQIYLNIFNLELTTIPLEDPTAVLDVGTGTGEWTMAMAERWPDCEVTGVDISPTFERAVPLNCHFEVLDGEDPWPWADNTFDMVHYRHMSGAFRDWNVVYSETRRCLKPGGWVEILEFHDHEGEKNFYDRFPPHSLMHKAAKDIERAELVHGKHRGIDHMEPELLENNGFVDCEVHEHIIPLDPSNSPLGKLWLVTLRAGFESYALRLLTKYMNWDAASVRMACESVGQQMIAMATNPALNKGFQIRLRVTIARKPLEPKSEPTPSQSGISVGDYNRDATFKPSPSSSSPASPFPAVPGTQYIYPNTAAQPRPPI